MLETNLEKESFQCETDSNDDDEEDVALDDKDESDNDDGEEESDNIDVDDDGDDESDNDDGEDESDNDDEDGSDNDDGEDESDNIDGDDESDNDDGEDESDNDDGEDESDNDDGEDESDNDDGEDESDNVDGDDGGTKSSSKKRKNENGDERRAKVNKVSDDVLLKMPSKEISLLTEMESSHHSDFFKMQMDELLETVKMKNKVKNALNNWMEQFEQYCKSIPETSDMPIDDSSWIEKAKLVFPFKKDSKLLDINKGVFKYLPPTKICLVGSHSIDAALKINAVVDVALVLPRGCLQANDFQNGRWLKKRALYMLWLAKELSKNDDLASNMQWVLPLGESLRPSLQITPGGNVGNKWKINLYPVPPEDYFKKTRFSPDKNSVRPDWFFKNQTTKKDSDDLPPTPYYNWLCEIDNSMLSHQAMISTTISSNGNLLQGLKLLKIWANQQQLNVGVGNQLSHILTFYVIHLLNTSKLNTKMSGYQVFRTVLMSLNTETWMEKTEFDSLNYHQYYNVVFLDTFQCINLCGGLDKHYFAQLQYEANLALNILGYSGTNSFEALFIKKKDFALSYDQYVCISLEMPEMKEIFKNKLSKNVKLDQLGNIRGTVNSLIKDIIKEGLENRISMLVECGEETISWNLISQPPVASQSIKLGFIIDPQLAWSLLTRGPSAENTAKAATFRKFWGEKSTLRRFQDGSFHEAVLWGSVNDSIGKRRLIPGEIVKYVLSYHYNIAPQNVNYIANQIESAISICDHNYNTGEENTVTAIQSFDALSRKLRALDLPLGISSIQSTSDVVRHAYVLPPKAICGKKDSVNRYIIARANNFVNCYTNAIDVLIFLEISGKWPDDINTMKAIKTEFHFEVAKQLKENGYSCICLPDHILILMNNFVFRLKICNRREIYLHRFVLDTNSDEWKEKDTESSIELEKEIEIVPRLSTALASIQADFPSYGGAVRLAKKWMSSQLLSHYFPPIVIELLMSHIYKMPAPYVAPNTPHAGFVRFVHALATTDWKTTPLLVNLNHNFSDDDHNEIMKRFTKNRSLYPPLFIATPYELRGLATVSEATSEELDRRYKLVSCWTRSQPTQILLHRTKLIAEATLKYLTSNIFFQTFKTKVLFNPSLEDYDVLIKLKHQFVAKSRLLAVESQKVADHRSDGKSMPVVMFEPAEKYLNSLRKLYKTLALFFFDENGGSVIGVVWLPDSMHSEDLKWSKFEYHQIIGVKEKKQIPNLEGVLETFSILGEGLVEAIDIKSD